MASQGCEELSFEAILGQFLLSGCIADTNLFREHYPVFRSVAQQFMGMFRADLADCIAMLLPLVCTEVFVSHPTERGYQRVPLSVYSTHRVGVVTTPQGMSVKKRLAEGWQKLFQIQATLNQARSARSAKVTGCCTFFALAAFNSLCDLEDLGRCVLQLGW